MAWSLVNKYRRFGETNCLPPTLRQRNNSALNMGGMFAQPVARGQIVVRDTISSCPQRHLKCREVQHSEFIFYRLQVLTFSPHKVTKKSICCFWSPVSCTHPTQFFNHFSQATFNFCRGHPVLFVKLKDNKTVSGFTKTQQYIILPWWRCVSVTWPTSGHLYTT